MSLNSIPTSPTGNGPKVSSLASAAAAKPAANLTRLAADSRVFAPKVAVVTADRTQAIGRLAARATASAIGFTVCGGLTGAAVLLASAFGMPLIGTAVLALGIGSGALACGKASLDASDELFALRQSIQPSKITAKQNKFIGGAMLALIGGALMMGTAVAGVLPVFALPAIAGSALLYGGLGVGMGGIIAAMTAK